MTTIRRKPTTIQDIANEVGVSKMTVSLVLSGKGSISAATRQLVWQTARRLNFSPNAHARRLSQGGCPNTIGLFSVRLDLGTSTQKIQLIQAALASRGFDVPAYAYDHRLCHPETPPPTLSNLRQQRPRAIVCQANGVSRDALRELELYQAEGGILICYDSPAAIDCDKVIFDRLENTYLACRHLLENGHRAIGFSLGGDHNDNRNNDRFAGFARAMAEFAAPIREEWILRFPVTEREQFYDGGRLAAAFLALPARPTAMCLADDNTAMAFCNHLIRAGVRVPADVSVIGADDAPVARNNIPSLSTVTHPTRTIAAEVVKLLLQRLEDGYEGAPRLVTVGSELVVRESTGRSGSRRFP